MSCVTPLASPRLAFPSHRTSAPLASILRSSRTPLNSPRSPAARAAVEYFSAGFGGGYEGATRTPVATPAAVGTAFPAGCGTALNSPRRGLGLSLHAGAGSGALDAAALARSLHALAGESTPVAPSPLSFAAAGAAFAPPAVASTSASSAGSLSARRRPSLRISDLPPLVMPQPSLESLHLLRMGSDASDASAWSEAETVVGGEWAARGLGLGVGAVVDGKRVPTPYPERRAWIEDGEGEMLAMA
ncbi:hypothetical protein JCM10207_005236 [Rhodosporidiobolus poonsookiae]